MQRLDPNEAQEITRLAAERNVPFSGEGPTVDGLAGALGLSPEEVERLLIEVRGRRMAIPTAPVELPVRRFGDRSAALSAAIVLALVLVVAAVGVGTYFFRSRLAPPVAVDTAPEPFRIEGPDGGVITMGPNGMKIQSGKEEASAPPAPPMVVPEPDVHGLADSAIRDTVDGLKEDLKRPDLSSTERATKESTLKTLEAQLDHSHRTTR